MEYLGVADQAVYMRFGKKISRRCHQQYIGTGLIQRQLHRHADIFFDLFLKTLQGIRQSRLRQAEIVAHGVDFADDLVGVFLAHANRGENLPAGHGDLCGVDAVRTVHRAAPAFRTLVVITVPVIDHLFTQRYRPHQFREPLSGRGEIAPVHFAHEILTRYRHILRVTRAEVIVALVSTRTALDAGIHEYLQGPVTSEQLAHLVERKGLPVLNQFTGKAQGLLVLRLGDKRPAVRHHVRLNGRRVDPFFKGWGFEFGFGHGQRTRLCTVCTVSAVGQIPGPGCQVAVFTRVIPHIAGRAEENTRSVQQFAERKNQHQDDHQRQVHQ